jgi:hypothetical protein
MHVARRFSISSVSDAVLQTHNNVIYYGLIGNFAPKRTIRCARGRHVADEKQKERKKKHVIIQTENVDNVNVRKISSCGITIYSSGSRTIRDVMIETSVAITVNTCVLAS